MKKTLLLFVILAVFCFGFGQVDGSIQAPVSTFHNQRVLPDYYWTDLITECPDTYVVDANGDVHLYSAEALAWFVSIVNGLNGQEVDDFDGKSVAIETNVDMSAARWVPIADGTNLGDPNPDRLKFCGSFNGNGYVINGLVLTNNPFQYGNFESFFGNLCGARIENVVLRHVYSEGLNERDGKFFGNAETKEAGDEARPTTIDRCFVEIDEMLKDGLSMDGGLFGYKNEGVITNSMVKCGKIHYPEDFGESEGLFVCYNYGTIENCASVVDSLKWLYHFGGIANENYGTIENCYSFIGRWFGDYQTWWPPIPRLGVCVANYGTIRNCYFNKFDPSTFSNVPAYTNQGVISNAESFFMADGWTLDGLVEIPTQNGIIYQTDRLLDALNYWISGRINVGDYMAWCEDNSFLEDDLPVLCDLDITNVTDNAETETLFSVYPIPADQIIRIDGGSITEVRLYNNLGQIIKAILNSNEVFVGNLPTGIYIMRIMSAVGSSHATIVPVCR